MFERIRAAFRRLRRPRYIVSLDFTGCESTLQGLSKRIGSEYDSVTVSVALNVFQHLTELDECGCHIFLQLADGKLLDCAVLDNARKMVESRSEPSDWV